DHRTALAAQVLGDRGDEEARLALVDGPRHGNVLPAQLEVDRNGADRVAQGPAPQSRDLWRGRRGRQGRPFDRDRGELDARQLPELGELARRQQLARTGQRVALTAPQAAREGAAVAEGPAAFDE